MLKFDDLALKTPLSRSRTPPVFKTPPPPRSNTSATGTSDRVGYPKTATRKERDRNKDNDEDEEDRLDDYDVNEGEDEFGLPSIVTSRRSTRRAGPPKLDLQKGTRRKLHDLSIPGPDQGDIGDERGGPQYPAANPSVGKILRPQYKEILRDPANALHLINHTTTPANASAKDIEAHATQISRINKFKRILQATSISLSDLRNASWSGIPEEVRSITWQVLLGYLPTNTERRVATLERKRKDYLDGIKDAFEKTGSGLISPITNRVKTSFSQGRSRGLDENVWHQISIDVPRTSPHIELYSYEATQRSLERILYLWAIRHPASGYVQGINDLVTPFWQVFLGTYITDSNIQSGMDPGQLPKSVLDAVEADTFWCLTKLLDGIQDNYIHAQPGIVRQVNALQDLIVRIDGGLAKHLEREGVEFMQFSFRWMNCLLMREVNIRCTIRMWDTYMAEEQGFSDFHLYVCAAFLVKWTDQLVKMDFQEVMMFLQALPTKQWNEKDVELLLSEAFIWQSLFRGSSAHLKNAYNAAAT